MKQLVVRTLTCIREPDRQSVRMEEPSFEQNETNIQSQFLPDTLHAFNDCLTTWENIDTIVR